MSESMQACRNSEDEIMKHARHVASCARCSPSASASSAICKSHYHACASSAEVMEDFVTPPSVRRKPDDERVASAAAPASFSCSLRPSPSCVSKMMHGRSRRNCRRPWLDGLGALQAPSHARSSSYHVPGVLEQWPWRWLGIIGFGRKRTT